MDAAAIHEGDVHTPRAPPCRRGTGGAARCAGHERMHVHACLLAGADVATLPFSVFGSLMKHQLTDSGLKKFLEDYRKTQEAKPVRNTAEEAAAKR